MNVPAPSANPDVAASDDDEYGYSVTLRAQHQQSASATIDQNALMRTEELQYRLRGALDRAFSPIRTRYELTAEIILICCEGECRDSGCLFRGRLNEMATWPPRHDAEGSRAGLSRNLGLSYESRVR